MNAENARKMVSDLELDQAPLLPPEVTKDELLNMLDFEGEHGFACGQSLLPPDCVELSIQKWVMRLENAGYDSDDSQLAVFENLAYLVEKEIVPDTPANEASDDEKVKWISIFDEKIYARLIAVGIDLTEAFTDEQIHTEYGSGLG